MRDHESGNIKAAKTEEARGQDPQEREGKISKMISGIC